MSSPFWPADKEENSQIRFEPVAGTGTSGLLSRQITKGDIQSFAEDSSRNAHDRISEAECGSYQLLWRHKVFGGFSGLLILGIMEPTLCSTKIFKILMGLIYF